MKFIALATIAITAQYASAYCPNLCSGHGACNSGDVCSCYDYIGTARGDFNNVGSAYNANLRAAWTGADCSLRTCPMAYSWSGATPNGLGVTKSASISAGTITISEDLDAGTNKALSAGSQIRTTTDSAPLTIVTATDPNDGTTVITTIPSSAASGTENVYIGEREDETVATASDSKDANGAHGMLECAGQGLCDRTTGNCECFPGYEGEACTRSKCPNECSGNGICLAATRLATDAGHTYQYAWDADKHFGCKCDAGFRGPDCSLQECPSDVDPLFGCGGGQCNTGGTDNSNTSCANSGDSDCTSNEQRDCSGRGICDYESGVCKCFSGFFGEACEKQTILI